MGVEGNLLVMGVERYILTSSTYGVEISEFRKVFHFAQIFCPVFCPDASIWNFYLHRRSGENLRCFWRRIRHD